MSPQPTRIETKTSRRTTERPAVAVWKFASCDGCQLSLLDCEDDLLTLAEVVNIAHFTEMSSANVDGPYDISLVEGSITTPADAQRILDVRAASRRLITIGACATAGGVQGLRNFAAGGEYVRTVYAHPDYISSLDTSTPISDHVRVDYELHGCPISPKQLMEVITAELVGRRPQVPGHSVCQECKARGNTCLLVEGRVPCLGPVVRAGCGALCPSVDRGCFGCFGPTDDANTASLAARLIEIAAPDDLARLFATFNAWAPAFKKQSQALQVRAAQNAARRAGRDVNGGTGDVNGVGGDVNGVGGDVRGAT